MLSTQRTYERRRSAPSRSGPTWSRGSSSPGLDLRPSSRARYGTSAPVSVSSSSSFARNVARADVSSPPSVAPLHARSMRMKGSYTRSVPNDRHCPSNHVARGVARTASSERSRVFPIPASPTRRTTRPRPASSSSSTSRRRPSSSVRSTSGVGWRTGTTSFSPTSRQADTARSRPFTETSPSGSRTYRSSSARAVASPTAIVPGSATLCSRAATFVASPTETARGSAAPTTPTATRPVLIPTRTEKSSISQRERTSCAYSSMERTIASPARAARSGSSSCTAGTPKNAAMPSPMYAWTLPPNCSTSRLIRVTASPISDFTS